MTTPYAILTDTTLCIGCEECVKACKNENDLTKDVPRRWKRHIDDLSSTRYTTIVRCPEDQKDHFVRQQCRHCLDPACVSACLVGALQQPEDSKGQPIGPVIYDKDRCMGCRYCMMACPFGIPRYDWEKLVPEVRKCDMCYARLFDDNGQLIEGMQPACVEACSKKATIFGPREELLAKARRRIENDPDKKLYGEFEVGGTSVLYLSDISLDFLSFDQELQEEKLPDLTLAALSKVPPLAAGVAGVMAGAWWIIGRRMKLAEETRQEPSESAQSSEKNKEK